MTFSQALASSLALVKLRRTREAGRVSDVCARLGGEEFGLLFPDASLEQACKVAERIRAAVAAAPTPLPDGTALHVTMSIGVATLAPGTTLDAAMSDADRALYQAKHQGRNQVAAAG